MSDPQVALQNAHFSLEVASLGAEMQMLRNAAGADLLWDGDAAYWTGRAPVLFPIVGRATDDVIEAGGLRATMPKHGFARRSRFSLARASDTMCQHVLHATPESRALYPFDFTLSVTHALEADALVVSVSIRNDSAKPMPFGFGFHPAFRWPLPGAQGQPHFVTLQDGGNPDRRPLRPDEFLEADLVPGPFENGVLEITDDLFANGALVFPGGTSALRYGPQNGAGLELTFAGLPDLALWRPLGAPFLCIEPWHGTSSHLGDAPKIADRPNSVVLAPEVETSFAYRLRYVS